MQLIKRVTQLAKDRALIKFTAMVRAMVADAESVMQQELADGRLGADQRVLRSALDALQYEGNRIVVSMDARFRDSVDRGVRTMYTDLRQGLLGMSANSLSLIDDETVNRQLEVGHLVQRLRDACDENLGRLNIMIAQMHGDADVHERENPFRPYLIARALHETLKERMADEELSKILFSRLSDSLAARLSEYYASICEVFDANGIQARLLARPTKLKKHQRDQLAQQLAALNSPVGAGNAVAVTGFPAEPGINPRILPALQRLFETLGTGNERNVGTTADGQASAPARTATTQTRQLQAEDFQDYIWKMFNQPAPTAESAGGDNKQGLLAPATAEVLQAIARFQQQAVEASGAAESSSDESNQLFGLGERLALPEQAHGERMAIDVVAVLFAFLLEDEQIPAIVRARIARLQIPFLKAALLEPQMLQETDHPARQFLNKIASAAVGLDPESAVAKRLDEEIARLVKRILQDFGQDMAIFSDCLGDLEHFLAEQLAQVDAETSRSIAAAEDAESFSANLRHTVDSLQEITAPMEVDQRVKDFIEQIWARVLVRAAAQGAAGSGAGLAGQYQEVLPELVWSAQEKATPEDRTALMRLLPGLIKRLRIGMLMIHMPEDECKAALDRLVPVHTQVLRLGSGSTYAGAAAGALPSLDALRREFSRLVTSDDSSTWILGDPLQIETEVLENALANRGADAELSLARPSAYGSAPSAELLSQLQVGTCVECRAGDMSVPARLVWVSKSHSLFIFKLDQQSKPLVYSASALLQALQSGKVGLIEYAPAFDRAVDALMMGADAVQSARS
ncbi:DUF1631 family protein [Janthinobacterium sp. 17J80-10]|uniref:DUF1631 family protein n=1 Tax=Janthinobacterium sp. 17J80-10 TaxID=2497863 RepID=UPI001005645D|nr:DUF1631 family protein [Janthinobacterium sp. 17J80-10]QAU34560.1 DUF1631 family protein [Janthinobacterium sp. 17J80-10]